MSGIARGALRKRFIFPNCFLHPRYPVAYATVGHRAYAPLPTGTMRVGPEPWPSHTARSRLLSHSLSSLLLSFPLSSFYAFLFPIPSSPGHHARAPRSSNTCFRQSVRRFRRVCRGTAFGRSAGRSLYLLRTCTYKILRTSARIFIASRDFSRFHSPPPFPNPSATLHHRPLNRRQNILMPRRIISAGEYNNATCTRRRRLPVFDGPRDSHIIPRRRTGNFRYVRDLRTFFFGNLCDERHVIDCHADNR